ncbi:DUF4268 domain-containing protein, partial [Ursidibacter sp. B-7004-1]
KELDFELSWERLDDKKASRISITNNEIFELYDKNSWNEAINWQIETMKIFEATFKKKISDISNKFISK